MYGVVRPAVAARGALRAALRSTGAGGPNLGENKLMREWFTYSLFDPIDEPKFGENKL